MQHVHAMRTRAGVRFRVWSTMLQRYVSTARDRVEIRTYLCLDASYRDDPWGLEEAIEEQLARAEKHGTSAFALRRDVDGPWDEERRRSSVAICKISCRVGVRDVARLGFSVVVAVAVEAVAKSSGVSVVCRDDVAWPHRCVMVFGVRRAADQDALAAAGFTLTVYLRSRNIWVYSHLRPSNGAAQCKTCGASASVFTYGQIAEVMRGEWCAPCYRRSVFWRRR